jgi:predicted ATP-grasp superfamily ATP-dependent carboligase
MTAEVDVGELVQQLHDIRVQLQKIATRLRKLEEAVGVEEADDDDEVA